MGRPAQEGHRTASGQLSRAQGARFAENDVSEQPHRRPFELLIGAGAATDWRAGFALGRLRMIGEAEDMVPIAGNDPVGPEHVRRVLYSGRKDAPKGPFGISERLFFAGMKYLEVIGRERWVRSAPKDKPSALAFMTARGIDLSARDLEDGEAAYYVQQYEDTIAALVAAPCSPDLRRVLRVLRAKSRKLGDLAGDMIKLLQGLGALMNPAASGRIKRAVEMIVIDDRDPDPATLEGGRAGLAVLADHFFGPEREDSRKIVGVCFERPTWPHDERSIELFTQHPDGSVTKGVRYGKDPRERNAHASGNSGGEGWKGRHRSHSGG